jgi:hypothetical protein
MPLVLLRSCRTHGGCRTNQGSCEAVTRSLVEQLSYEKGWHRTQKNILPFAWHPFVLLLGASHAYVLIPVGHPYVQVLACALNLQMDTCGIGGGGLPVHNLQET